jgi:hypothetical protein
MSFRVFGFTVRNGLARQGCSIMHLSRIHQCSARIGNRPGGPNAFSRMTGPNVGSIISAAHHVRISSR